MRIILVLLALLLALPALANDDPSGSAGVFDQPAHLRREILGGDKYFPPDPENPGMKREEICYYYEHFMVEQVDIGEEGAARLSIVPVTPGKSSPPCQTASVPGEYVISASVWSGYFKGATGNFVFFDADDGTQGGMGFAVFDAAKKAKIFEDIAMGDIKSIEPAGGGLKLRYRRAYPAACSLPAQGKKCWDDITSKVDLKGASMPDCVAPYLQAKTEMAHAQCEYGEGGDSEECFKERMTELDAQKWNDDPTVIGYDVETEIGNGSGKLKSLKGGAVCWPAD